MAMAQAEYPIGSHSEPSSAARQGVAGLRTLGGGKRENVRGVKVNLGCGPGPQPANWVHVDGSWNARLSKFDLVRRTLSALGIVSRENASLAWTPDLVTANLRGPLPFSSGTVDCVYASHVLEHLHDDEARRLLRECFRVLKPGGVLRLVVPDLRGIVERYVASASRPARADSSPLPADRLNEDLHLRPRSVARGNVLFRLYSTMTEFHTHKWMYDAESLTERVRSAGFVAVEERGFLDSGIPGIQEIERAHRVIGGEGICVEGVKPG
ncbi:MAG: methyltransferase domain-containing protein [Acidobacteria bacterium]|nr:methyltransferase domain-containing protein [Acidobacteriota bacterium]